MFSLLSLSWWIWGCKLVLTVPIHQDFEAKWIPPSAPFFKVKVDGLFSLHRRKQAWEFLAIDSWAKALVFFLFWCKRLWFSVCQRCGNPRVCHWRRLFHYFSCIRRANFFPFLFGLNNLWHDVFHPWVMLSWVFAGKE